MEQLLQAISADVPSGEDLEYDPGFTALMLAARPGEERHMGDQTIAAEEPDHRSVIEKSMSVLKRSHDLRVAVVLAPSKLRIEGFTGLAEVTGYIRGCLEQFWDSCHPALDPDDDDDPTMRINAILGLADPQGLIGYLRLAPLSESSTFGRVSLRDLAIADGEIEAPADMARKPDPSSVMAAFKDTKIDVLRERFEAIAAILEDVRAIDRVFDDRTPGQGPDLSGLTKLLRKAHVRMGGVLGEETPVVDDTGATSTAAPAASISGAVTSPADVRRTLEALIRYYETYEPSSPLPMLLHRAHRLVGADFLTIMRDLAPESVGDLRKIGGMPDEENDDD